MDNSEWRFILDSVAPKWNWIYHSECAAYIWSNWCECNKKVPDHIVLQAQILGQGFQIWDSPQYPVRDNT